MDPWLVLAGLALEAAIGYPAKLQIYVSHPVTWAGRSITFFETLWNDENGRASARKLRGCLTVICVAGAAGVLGFLIQHALTSGMGVVIVILLATVGLAQRSLYQHVQAVIAPLERGDVAQARAAVAHIVGRDVTQLNETGVAAAALESLAESFSDGVVAPAFWLLIGGLPGLFIYKAVNTADSLIGHREPKWRHFGWAAARTDDLLNLTPARLAGMMIVAAGRGGWRCMVRDAAKHSSPNAGWPEAAMAGALNVRLGGPAFYDGAFHDRPVFGAGPVPHADDVRRGLRIYIVACAVLWAVMGVGGMLWRL